MKMLESDVYQQYSQSKRTKHLATDGEDEKLSILSKDNEYMGKSEDKYNDNEDKDSKRVDNDVEHKEEHNLSLETLSVKKLKTYFKLLNSNNQVN